MTTPLLRPYEDKDLPALLDLWEKALPFEALPRDEFERRVVLDVNREPESLMLAFENPDGPPLGFALALVIHRPIEKTGCMEHRGFITAFGVHPEARKRGVGGALLDNAERFLIARNRREVAIAPYTPNYFVPGVDTTRYADGLAFLKKRGYETITDAIAMDALIGTFEIDPKTLVKEEQLRAEGITVEPFRRDFMHEYLEFMRTQEDIPGPWLEDARRNLVDMTRGLFPEDGIYVARDHGKIIGYCQYEGQHFGPFGVSDKYQGKGIGSVLLARTLYQMRKRGNHVAFVLWTGDRAAQGVYGRLGFTISRRLAILRKTLAPA